MQQLTRDALLFLLKQAGAEKGAEGDAFAYVRQHWSIDAGLALYPTKSPASGGLGMSVEVATRLARIRANHPGWTFDLGNAQRGLAADVGAKLDELLQKHGYEYINRPRNTATASFEHIPRPRGPYPEPERDS